MEGRRWGGQNKDGKEIKSESRGGGGGGQMRVRQPQWLTNYLTVLFTSHMLPLSYLGLKRQQLASSSSHRTPMDRKMALCKLTVFCLVWGMDNVERLLWRKRTNIVLQSKHNKGFHNTDFLKLWHVFRWRPLKARLPVQCVGQPKIRAQHVILNRVKTVT